MKKKEIIKALKDVKKRGNKEYMFMSGSSEYKKWNKIIDEKIKQLKKVV